MYTHCMYKSATMKLLFYVKTIKPETQNSKEIENANGVLFKCVYIWRWFFHFLYILLYIIKAEQPEGNLCSFTLSL